jgi:Glutathione synthase/Ribosomal protein S6 modification enzyme (glutaminyl transferase)
MQPLLPALLREHGNALPPSPTPRRPLAPTPPLLLRGPRFRTRSPRRSCDFQQRVGRPETDHGDGPTPCVVLLTRAADREADALSVHLAAAGVPLVRFDCDRAPGTGVTYELGAALDVAGVRTRPLVVWSRYFTPASIPADAADPRLAGYLRGQWAGWRDLLIGLRGARVVNRAGVPGRITQLDVAADAGLRVPATVVTSTPAAAAAALPGAGPVIVKSLGDHYVESAPGVLDGVFARTIGRAELAREPGAEGAPVIVQEAVAARAEWRVYVVGGRFHTFASAPHAASAPFVVAELVPVRLIDTPAAIRGPLTELVHRWQLDVVAFDLLDTPDGPVFLEANAACDWLWLERATSTRVVTDAVVAELTAAYRAGLAA